jgi:hypothetical protein
MYVTTRVSGATDARAVVHPTTERILLICFAPAHWAVRNSTAYKNYFFWFVAKAFEANRAGAE